MKKTLLLLCLAATIGKAQPYGEKLYPHPLTFCTSGLNTSINPPGFITSGIVPANPGGFANFYIDKTGPGGFFAPASAVPFSNAYYVFGENSCSSLQQVKIMTGVDVIEAPSSSMGGWYAAAGVFEHGAFFTLLDPNGNVLSTGYYPFPVPTQNASKPIIVASPNPDQYFICGSYEIGGLNTMYVINVLENGSLGPAGSMIYSNPGSMSSVIPADMILSPYAPAGVNELVVVGKTTNAYGPPGTGDRGFILRLDVNNLFLTAAGTLWGQPPFAGGMDWFSSISEAFSGTNGGNGFVIGGHTDVNPGAGFLWTLKVDPTCTMIYWNTLSRPMTDPMADDVIAIKERWSGFNGAYEYYGAVVANNGMMVIKLDDFGNAFAPGNNEFVYAGPMPQPSVVRDLTYINNTGGSDVGIHVYGTDDRFNGGFHHFVEATFNGVSGLATSCNSFQTPNLMSTPCPNNFIFRDVLIQPGLSQCALFVINTQNLTTRPRVQCNSTTIPPGGNNNRMALATGIDEQGNTDNTFMVSPNPVSDRVEVKFNASETDAVDIKLYDYLGRFIQSVPVTGMDSANARTATLDLSTLNIESGIYIIHATINGISSQQKIIYTKGQ